MEQPELVAYITVGLVLFWIGLCHFSAHFSGWKKLARKYGTVSKPTKKRYFFETLRIGWSKYRNSITFRIGPEGLYISVIFLVRIGHPPILIPWRAIKITEKESGFLLPRARFVTADGVPDGKEITVPLQVINDATELGYLS